MKKLILKNTSYKKILKSFKEWLDILGYSNSLIKYYPSYLQEFFYWLEENNYTSIKIINRQHVTNYYEYLKQRPNEQTSGALSNASLNNHISALKKLNEYLKTQKVKTLSIHLRLEKIERITQNDILTQQEIKQLFKATDYSNQLERIRLRDKAILVVLYSCGLRRNEAVNLDLKDVYFDKERILIRKAKNKKQRFVPLNKYNLRILEDYIYESRPKFYQSNQTESLFISMQGKRLQGQSFKLRLRAILKASNNETIKQKNITPHKLRHSIATHLLEKGVKIEAVSQFLGHSSLESTQIYTHVANQKDYRNGLYNVSNY